MIPKKIHIVWIGEEGTAPEACIDSWRQLNPDYELILWGNDDLSAGQWTNRDHMRAMLAHDVSGVIEMMRYEILLREGGITVDALSIANRPMQDWLLETEAFACWQDELDELGLISTAIIGAEPGAAVLRQVIQDIRSLATVTDRPVQDGVGSRRLTKSWRASRSPMTIHPSHYFPTTKGEVCLYNGSGIVFAERLQPADSDASAGFQAAAGIVEAADSSFGTEAAPDFSWFGATQATDAQVAGPGVGDTTGQGFAEWADQLTSTHSPGSSADLTAGFGREPAQTFSGPVPADALPVLVGAAAAASGQRIIASELGYAEGQTADRTPVADQWPAPVLSAGTGLAGSSVLDLGQAAQPHTPSADWATGWSSAQEPEKRFRLLVATDWSSATVPLAVLKAYHEMIPVGAPVDLVFSLPHEAGPSDVDCLEVLLEGTGAEGDSAGLLLESHEESSSKACFGAVIPTGNADAMIMELAQLFTSMHQLADLVRNPDQLAKEPAPVDGFNAGLQRRLSTYAQDGR